MKALIVDDNNINLKVASKMLEKEGLQVDTVLSGKEWLEKVKNSNYDIIFMDIMMPEMDGKETFSKLQEIEGFNTPVVTLTADTEESKEEYLTKYHFNGYLSKPLRIEELKKVLNKIKTP